MNDQILLAETVRMRRLAERGPALPLDPDAATATILLALSSGDALPAEAFALLAERNRALLNETEDEIAASLARQTILLEALFLNFAAKATQASKVDHMVGLSKAATNVHRSLLAAQGALRQVTEDRLHADAVDT